MSIFIDVRGDEISSDRRTDGYGETTKSRKAQAAIHTSSFDSRTHAQTPAASATQRPLVRHIAKNERRAELEMVAR
jgi:hypothetical protein